MKRNMVTINSALVLFLILTFITVPNRLAAAEKETNKKGYLGVSVQELSRHDKKDLKVEYGVIITNIEEDSPADKDGLMEDDVIQQVNDVKITRSSTLTRVIRKITPGDKANITVIRDGKTKTIPVTIGKQTSSRSFAFSMSPGGKNLFGWYGAGRAYLGVQLQELNKDLAPYFSVKEDEGALILAVEEDSPAAKAGLKAGDVITKIDDEEISDPEDVKEITSELEEGDEIKIEFIRQNKKQTLNVELEEREWDHNMIISPERKIKELRLDPGSEKSFELLLPENKKDQKQREIIIEKNLIRRSQPI